MTAFTIDARKLSEALNLALNSSEGQGTLPWLSYVLIDAQGDGLRLSATNMDMAITVSVEANVREQGAFCVKGKQLANLVALLDNPSSVTIAVKNNQVWADTDLSSYRLPYLSSDQFQFIDTAKDEKLTISGEVLAGMLRAASIAMETNPNGKDSWKCLELCAGDGKLQITGMCGPRAATTSIPCDGEFYVMLPANAVAALIAFASKSDSLTLFISDNVMTACFGDNEATFKLSGLKWADWHPIVDAKCKHRIEFDSDSFLPALKRAILAADQNRLVTRVDFKLQNKQVDLFSESANGEGNEKLEFDCPTLNGEVLPIAVNGLHLLDLFRVVKGGVIWELLDNSALRFTPKEPLPFSFAYIVGTLARGSERF